MPDYARLFDMIGKDAKDKAFVSAQVPFNIQVGTRQFMECAFAMFEPAANTNKPDPKLVVANAFRETSDDIRGVTAALAAQSVEAQTKSDVLPHHDLLRDFVHTSQETFNIAMSAVLMNPVEEMASNSIDSTNPVHGDNVVPFKRKRRKTSAPL